MDWTDKLTDEELTVLDLALSYFADTVRKTPSTLSTDEQHRTLLLLRGDVLNTKAGREGHSMT